MKTIAAFSGLFNQKVYYFIPAIWFLGMLALAIPATARLEMDLGLEWLFKLRGERPPPPALTIVTIDKHSSATLDLPNHPRKWPRNLHAELVDKLTANGAAVIGFDIIFSEPREREYDHAFASAMQRNANVVLFDYLEAENRSGVHLEKHRPPIPLFEQAAIAVAPFTLPKVPEHIKQAWLFKKGIGETATIPVIMLVKLLAPETSRFNSLINEVSTAELQLPSLAASQPAATALRYNEIFATHPEIIPALNKKIETINDPEVQKNLRALMFTFSSGEGIVLDFYGPPHSIQTISYSDILTDQPFDLENHAVLVGFSELLQPEQKDGFYTVFTDEAGLDISGVELMATTLGNLLEARSVESLSLPRKLLLVSLFGILAGWLLFQFSGYKAVLASVFLGVTWLGVTLWAFSIHAIWLPLTTPLLLQLPAALLLTLTSQYQHVREQRQHLDSTLRRYLPASIADSAIVQTEEILLAKKENIYATCLATDLTNYTQFAEATSPDELHERLNHYFEHLFPRVYENQGIVIDVVGDAMLAIWHKGSAEQQKQNAIITALAIKQSLRRDNQLDLTTRMGVHCGEVSLGSVGSGEHFEFRAIGDAVNTTTRIEQLNKLLGTNILVSSDVIGKNTSVSHRSVGQFLLRGKEQVLTVFELLDGDSKISDLAEEFEEALKNFQRGEFRKSEEQFLHLAQHTTDSVAEFYMKQCRLYHQSPPDSSWDGCVIVK